MLDTDTKRRIDTCRDLLVGKVPDPKSQVEQITIALIYKFMDDMDAESEALGGRRSFFTGKFSKYGWSRLMAPGMGGSDMLDLYSEAIRKMTGNSGLPQLFRDIFKNAYLPYRDPETLRNFLKEIDTFTYDHSERLGDAFEYLLSVLGSQGDAGQFRTPRHIIDFMVEIIDPKKNETILDPACGTAGFLIASYKHILKHNTESYRKQSGDGACHEQGVPVETPTLGSPLHYKGDLLTPDERQRLAANIRGYDISPDMVRLSLVNMYLHGITDPHIEEYDTLTSKDNWNHHADVILANPPFMSPKGGIKPHKDFAVQSRRSEVLFVDYMAEHLTPNGRAAVVVPEGIIFQSQTAYKRLREMLVKHYLAAVVSLPAGVFNPYSGVKTSILILDRRLARKTTDVLFVKIENDGFNLGAQRRAIEKNDLPEAVRVLKTFLNHEKHEKHERVENRKNVLAVSRERIGENGEWNLSGERYRIHEVAHDHREVEIGEITTEIRAGFACGKSAIDQAGVPHIRPMNITDKGGFSWEGTKYISETEFVGREEYKLKAGDILFNNTNSKELVGKTCYIENSITCGFSNHITRIRVDEKECVAKFLALLLHNLWRQGVFLDTANKWIGQAGINRKALSSLKIPLPPLEVQKEIVAEIEGYQSLVSANKELIRRFEEKIKQTINRVWGEAQ